MPSDVIVAWAVPWKRSFQITSLASRRLPHAASCSPAAAWSSVSFVARNVSSRPWSPYTRSCSASTACRVRRRQRSRRVEVARALDVELLALHEAAELRLELSLRQPGRREERREVGADLGRVVAHLADAREVVAVCRLVVRPGAALNPHREKHDDEDRERDEPGETEERRDPVRRPDLRSTRPSARRPGRRRLAAVRPFARAARPRASRPRRSRSPGCRRRARSRSVPAGPVAHDVTPSTPSGGRVYGRFGGGGRSPATAKDGYRCLLLPSHSPIERSSSTAIARSSRSDAAARARSGWRVTSRPASRSL